MKIKNIYAQIDVLELKIRNCLTPRFDRSTSAYLLGAASKHAKSPAAINLGNQKLVEELSTDVLKALMIQSTIKGGADSDDDDHDDWDNVAMDDLESLLLNEPAVDKGKTGHETKQLGDSV
ncbi:hypothetical protein JG687_00014835 [Phytophthora cactorum]|uniref:Uncharacterized protein n=1 Tax=Phytophthora cactorum TaxID=29920 RepID=A0A8T1TYK8_9STRA|nr:hypothetical protein PC120_g18672 [Phytophthora cactorum]KAG3083366.1 hypothetical protein PC121_g5745 [Phytophthora cactorum]KAG4044707.1 hypothetical protein PC123_g19857 [Phytophthora cactorum]KAG6949477.1 hypothetical protein JG687_00014835 [Phytophthora cactorum]